MKKIFVKIAIVAVMLIWACATVVNAFSFTVTMTPSKTNVAESNEFIVTIKVSNLDVGQYGINSLIGYLKYDKDVFETISDSSIEGLNAWSPTFNSENGKVELTKMNFVKSEEAVFQITFKTKSGVSGKSGIISFENISASNGSEDVSATNISTTIVVGNSTANTTNTSNTANNIVVNNEVANNTVENNTARNNTTGNNTIVPIRPSNNTTNNATKRNNTSSTYNNIVNNTLEEDIPYTGAEDTVMYVMIVVLALAIIFYVKYLKINKELK